MAEKKKVRNIIRSVPLDYVDYAKGFGILLVMLGHVNLVVPKSNHLAHYFVQLIYSFHMPLFFVITGFLLGYKDSFLKKDTAPALKAGRLFVRLMIPYYIYSVIYILIGNYRYGYTDEYLSDMITAVWTTMGSAPLWFLSTLFFARLLFHFLKYKLKLDTRAILLGALYASLLTVKIFSDLKTEDLMEEKTVRFLTIPFIRVIPAVFFIAFGFLFFRFIDPKNKSRNLVCGLILGVTLIACCNLYTPDVNMHTLKFESLPLFLLTGVTGSASLILICSALPQGIRPLRELGKDSMDIMVIHYDPFPFFFIANDIVFEMTGGRNFILIWLVTCLMVIPIAIIWNRIKNLPKIIISKLKKPEEKKQTA
ncbi:acyltransferase family protein [Ruminococcus albus]|uniref:Fucose 4-O-acetylase n=1 Tax=Ruminococcus albus TaxID=1264 RepID=A0A1I1DD99_RUMAL|nr:acyltransferase [Ruminococcus albus]SFB72346.1 Fucose 4-O-acetylase [Ruminococcus albus]